MERSPCLDAQVSFLLPFPSPPYSITYPLLRTFAPKVSSVKMLEIPEVGGTTLMAAFACSFSYLHQQARDFRSLNKFLSWADDKVQASLTSTAWRSALQNTPLPKLDSEFSKDCEGEAEPEEQQESSDEEPAPAPPKPAAKQRPKRFSELDSPSPSPSPSSPSQSKKKSKTVADDDQ